MAKQVACLLQLMWPVARNRPHQSSMSPPCSICGAQTDPWKSIQLLLSFIMRKGVCSLLLEKVNVLHTSVLLSSRNYGYDTACILILIRNKQRIFPIAISGTA